MDNSEADTDLKTQDPAAAADERGMLGMRLAVIAAGFTLVVAAGLLALRVQSDPFDSSAMAELHEPLRREPDNDQARTALRELDLRQRQAFFSRQRRMNTGRIMLFAGALVWVAGIRLAARRFETGPRVPEGPVADEHWDLNTVKRRSLAVMSATALFGALVIALLRPVPVQRMAGSLALPTPGDAPPEVAERSAWPRFRGPDGQGRADQVGSSFSSVTELGAELWRIPVFLPGNSSPVVLGRRVIVTGGNEKERKVFAFDVETGALIWERAVPGMPGAETPALMFGTGYAASSPAVDDGRIFAVFATGDVAAIDRDGGLLWTRHLGAPDNPYGHASSLIAHEGRVYVQMDAGHMPEDELSSLYALGARDGSFRWTAARPVSASWTTPVYVHGESAQVVASAPPWLMAHDPASGAELWRARLISGEIASSPVFAHGRIYVASEHSVAAVRTDGRGDVTDTHIDWQQYEGLPDTVSPLATDSLLFLVTSYGLVTCYDIHAGEPLWSHDFETEFYASPSLVGQNVLVLDRSGTAYVFEADRSFRLVARHELGEPVHASPAFAGHRMFIRGETHLIAYGLSLEGERRKGEPDDSHVQDP